MNEKIVIAMEPHENKPKHSTRFEFVAVESGAEHVDVTKFKPSFYIPKPFASNARRLRVTIEVIG